MKINPLAQELNQTLEGTAALRLLSAMGLRMFFPKGIVAQAAEAGEKAHRFNATVGIANEKPGIPIMLKAVQKEIPNLVPKDIVSYAPTSGDPELRKLWKEHIIHKNPKVKEDYISLPIVTSGLTSGLSQVADLFANPGDKIFLPEYFWGNYRLLFEGRAQAELVTYPLFSDEGIFNTKALKDSIKASGVKKAIVILNFPNNPTGYSPTEKEAESITSALTELAEDGIDILAVTDDAYFGLFYEEGIYTHSIFEKLCNAHPNILAVKADGPTKELYAWGFRTGFLTFGSPVLSKEQFTALEKKLGGSLRASISNSNRLAQTLVKKILTDPQMEKELEEWAQLLKSRYKKTKQILANMPLDCGLSPLPFNSGYFMSFKTKVDAEELRKALLAKGIGTISLGPSTLRVTFASIPEENLEELFLEIFKTAKELNI
ncbi:aminotransferase class I/II-fold pyridoxal phosphate-dependent enzyme [Spirochaetia bacterium 38H-sp]|uniref:Aminotransferase class I/II-fold pyridoxal phosphate-dependent enzyme n=1 Tax=Rarispira pelagica TaxID=3141764 RepID=A0ABU9U9P7_9SPIR